jgi:hypothetical protein
MVKMNIHYIIQRIKDIPYDIKYGVLNLIKWFPVIWKDRDWDHYFIYMILNHKLKRMEKAFNSDRAMVLYSKRQAKQIKRCIILLGRLMEDEYHENASIKYHKKWGRPKFDWIPVPDDPEFSMLEITHDKVKTKEDKKQEKKEFHRICDHEVKMRKQDVDYLFKYMRKHIEGWWD